MSDPQSSALTLPPHPAAVDACLGAIDRVAQIVEQETFALKQRQRNGLEDFNRRKSHGLLDLTRAIRAVGSAVLPRETLAPKLRLLQAKLAENAAVLRMNLEAVQEISAVMARAIRDGESDGTYSATIRFPGGKR